jgi:hypothetical protein
VKVLADRGCKKERGLLADMPLITGAEGAPEEMEVRRRG